MYRFITRSYTEAFLILDRQTWGSIFIEGPLSGIAKKIFDNPTYKLSESDLAAYAKKHHPLIIADTEEIRIAIQNIYNTESKNFIANENKKNGDALSQLSRFAVNNWQLTSANIELTHQCNQRCKCCYLDSFTQKGLSKENLLQIGNQLLEANVIFVSFTGGEIFFRQDIMEILTVYNDLGFAIEIKTNGTLIDEDKIYHLSQMSIIDFQISIYETNNGYSDFTSSNYDFDKLIQSIRKLIQAKIPITLSVLIGNHNINNIFEIHKKLREIGDMDIFYSPYITPNRGGLSNEKYIRLSYEDMQNKFLPFLKEINGLEELDKYRDCSKDNTVCFAGRDQIALSPDGTVYPCLDMQLPLGNILEVPLSQILDERAQKLKFSIQEIPKCCNCDIRDYCDSCPGVSLIENGTYKIPIEHKCDVTRFYHKNNATCVALN